MLTILKKLNSTLSELFTTQSAPHPLFISMSAYIMGACYAYNSTIGMVTFASSVILLSTIHRIHRSSIIMILPIIFASTMCGNFLIKYQIEKFEAFQKIAANGPFDITLCVQNYKQPAQKRSTCCVTGIITNAQHSITQQKYPEFINATISFYCTKQQHVTVGDAITFHAVSCAHHNGTGDFTRYLLRQGIHATVHTNALCTVIERNTQTWQLLPETLQESTLEQSNAKIAGYTATLFNSIFLGYKDATEKRYAAIRQQFRQWGIEHYLARSGLHMALLAWLWVFLISWIPLSFIIKTSLVIMFACIYALCTVPSISFMRTFLFFCCYKLLTLCDAPLYSMHTFALILFAIIIYNPMHLFFLDFQLSFILAGSLIWIHTIIKQKKQRAA
jgi:ComEC/Rec2-related protein